MIYLLDTNIVIALVELADAQAIKRAQECGADDIVTSTIVLAEVALGTRHGDAKAMDKLAAFREEVPVLDFDVRAALAYGSLPFKRASFDRLIAAHALSLGLIVVTANERDFADVPGLKVENWMV
jgi:tRNA(fMet)-specific endonuclease VapC